mmetsp:Transcript_48286/g.114459  ORF Transcript_48286/g.114459 Transcript_48286/m.114459 type:complete len:155 (-) Transcript_48286:246-710(-)
MGGKKANANEEGTTMDTTKSGSGGSDTTNALKLNFSWPTALLGVVFIAALCFSTPFHELCLQFGTSLHEITLKFGVSVYELCLKFGVSVYEISLKFGVSTANAVNAVWMNATMDTIVQLTVVALILVTVPSVAQSMMKVLEKWLPTATVSLPKK